MATAMTKARVRNLKKCPWCRKPIRKATASETAALKKKGTPDGYTMTVHTHERCTACNWIHIHAEVNAAA